MKARTIHTAPKRAENIFTDREEPRRAFWAVYDRVKSDPGSVEVISYYGIGGIGKSSLLIQLMRELKERAQKSPNVFYSFELSGRNKDDCLYFLAESLMQQCPALQFPLFGAALLQLNKLAGRDILDLEKRLENSVLNRGELTAAVDVLNAVVPYFGVAKVAGQAGLKLFQMIKNNHEHNLGENADIYQEIEGSGAAELMNNLQKYFCMDAAPFLEQQSPPVVIMLDGYEVLTNTLERGDIAEVEDGWIWGSEGVIWSLPNTLWVVAGRNRLVWDRYDSEIRDSLEQHLLGNISENDTKDFLRQSGVAEDFLHHEIYELTGGTPVYLDMCVNTYRQLKAAKGAEYLPTAEDFGQTPTALAERFLRGMNSEHQRVIKLIACLPASWAEDFAIEAAQNAGYLASRGPFDDICRLSLVEKDGSHNKLHSTLRSTVRRFMTEEERQRLDNTVFRLLLARMQDEKYRAEREDYATLAAELLEDEDTSIEVGVTELRTILAAADAYNDLGNYRAFYEYAQMLTAYATRHACGEAAQAVCSYHMCRALLNLGRYQDANEPGRIACEFYLRTYGTDHPDSLDCMQNYANCHYRLGDWAKARELTQTIYEARLRVNGCDHEKTAGCINNLAIYSVMLGDFQNAAEMMELSHSTMCRLKGEEHPQTVICLNNLAAVYNKLGDHAKATGIIEKVYEIQRRTLGDNHPDVLISIFNLAVGYGAMEQYEKALELAQKAYDDHMRILGDEHPDTFAALNFLAESYLKLGNLAMARQLAREALSKRLRCFGADHPDTVESYNLLAQCE